MDTLILYMLSNNKLVTKYDFKEYWLDIGRIDDYEKAQGVYNKHFRGAIG